MNIKKDVDLLFEVSSFRFVQRTWKRFQNPDVSNNVEHSYRVMWTALILAGYEGVRNTEKIIKMALVHDLPESRTGDVDYLSRQYTSRKEDEAAVDIFKDSVLEKEMLSLFHEYEKRETIESKIVKDADNLDVELELVEQESRGHAMGKMWNKTRMEGVYPKLFTKSAKRFWKEIHATNPHRWHLEAKNRHNSGDWKKVIKDKKNGSK